MTFLDGPGGAQVAPQLVTNGDCLVAMPPLQSASFGLPVREIRVTVTGPGAVYLDDVTLN